MLTCISRSMNDKLYEMMLSLCPREWKFIKISGASADSYLDYIFNTKFDTKWILNLDEDCFIINHENIYKLISFMEKNDYDYCGFQDGGELIVRIHNPLVANPFFNLFNVEKIYQMKKDYYPKKYSPAVLAEKYSHYIRFKRFKYVFDDYEPFYTQFFWLLDLGLKPYFFQAEEYLKEKYHIFFPIYLGKPYYCTPTIIYDNEGEEIAIHSWHSRYYKYPNIKKSINNCYKYAYDKSLLYKKEKKIVSI